MKYNGITNVGNVRENNEDSIYMSEDGSNLFIVADGMGGHLGGEVASSSAVEEITNALKDKVFATTDELKENIRDAITKANREIFLKSVDNRNCRGMGTTLSFVYLIDNTMLFVNIGDSRIYVMNDEKFQQITVDDSYVNYLLKIGEISEAEALVHPKKNVLTQALGTSERILFNINEIDLTKESISHILLASDGLTNMVEDKIIREIVLNNSVTDATENLVNEALKNGGLDNVSVVLVDLRR